ncbi:MAG: formylglycine-generating enzyme family protein [Candidatus Moranbacteria bacterium]|nr:formylglycine-generating enzyme family protein [Candidatus Moranbacteria bacterium]
MLYGKKNQQPPRKRGTSTASAEGEVIMANNIDKNEPDASYICIPGGTYIYSENGQEVTVGEMYVACYPVTNRQYRAFIDYLAGSPSSAASVLPAGEYEEALQEFADSDASPDTRGMQLYLQSEKDLARLFRSEYDDDRNFNKDDQPVVGVSWYAARAYCLWLSMLDPEGWPYMLPTEQQWEWAAGGRRDRSGEVLEVREYPWGDKPKPTPKYANHDENEGQTTPVGSYPDGATPEGLFDMVGNVWEWMENWDDYDGEEHFYDPEVKRLRGGSWDRSSDELGCSDWYYENPGAGANYIGFRVVRSRPH